MPWKLILISGISILHTRMARMGYSVKRKKCLFLFLILMHTLSTVYAKKYAHGFCFAVICCGYTLTDFPISNGLTSLALW